MTPLRLTPILFAWVFMVNTSQAALVFSDLSITPSGFSVRVSGTMPTFTSQHRRLLVFESNPLKSGAPNWVIGPNYIRSSTTNFTGSQPAHQNISLGSDFYGEYVYHWFSSNLSDGEALDGTLSASWSSRVFDPSVINSIDVYWGNLSSTPARGQYLGTATAASAVPDPGSTFVLCTLGFSALGLGGIVTGLARSRTKIA